MFNYWTEGGFIAWGQESAPNTGKTPLQLFMDGRAQAAYDPQAYKNWAAIMFSGPIVRDIRQGNGKFTNKDYAKIGEWADKQLKKNNAWLVLMPAKEFGKPFVRALEYNANWQVVFFNNRQKMFVDVNSEYGKQLVAGILAGEVKYPREFEKNIVMANITLTFDTRNGAKRKGLEYAIKACELNPSQASMRQLIFAGRFKELRLKVAEFCKNYLKDFQKNKDVLRKQDGYYHKIVAALLSMDYLQQQAKKQKDETLAKHYMNMINKYEAEMQTVNKEKRW